MTTLPITRTDTSGSLADIVRQSLNIILLVTMILASNVEAIFGVGRSIAAQSDVNDTPLVPFEFAFAIWGPIFLGLAVYAVIQGLPSNRTRAVFRHTGWWTALAFGATTLWGLAAALLLGDASTWATALLFLPIVAGACIATLRFTTHKHDLSTFAQWFTFAPVSLYAGWVSLAVFLNWAQLGIHGGLGFGLSITIISVLVLALGLAFAAWQLHLNRGNKFYAFSILWGLALLAYGRLMVDDLNLAVGIAAVVGFLVVLGSCVVAARRRDAVNV